MKRLLLSVSFFLLFINAFSQVENNHNYSVGLRVYSLMQMPKILNQTNSQDYVNTLASGVFVKFNDNQISYRVSAAYYNNRIRFDNQCSTCQEANGKQVDYYFKAGFEKSFNYSVVQPYFGFDIGYRSNNFTGVVSNIQPGNTSPSYNVETIKTGLLLAPVIGIKINFIPQLTAYAEGTLDFYYAYERRETVDQVVGSPTVLNRFTRLEYLLNPVSLGIQFHFGAKN